MKVKKKIIGNWKMNGLSHSLKEIELLIENYNKNFPEIIICPPFTLLSDFKNILKNSDIKLGAQNSSQYKNGAFTGEVSAEMLKDIGVSTVLVGHSERREVYKETDEIINLKIKQLIENSLCPVLCIGETEEERKKNRTFEKVNNQIINALKLNKINDNFIIAYEPIWAIGSGKIPSFEEIEEVHSKIKETIKKELGSKISEKISILYGGSVKPNNAKKILELKNVDGVLVGGASLKFSDFSKILSG